MKYWLTGIILVVVGLVALYVFNVRQPPAEEVAELPPIAAVPSESPPPAQPLPEPVEVEQAPVEPAVEEPSLPPLEESDSLATETLSGLVGGEQVERLVVSEQVIPRLVATIDSLSGRQVPASIAAVEGPGGEFQATANDDPDSVILNAVGDPIPQFVLDPANYPRYAPYVEMLEAADPDRIVAAYRADQPLFEQAFRQLGYPEGNFDQRLRALLDELLATPEVVGPVRLIKPEAYYLFADKELESLTAGQKILIRMGPDNAARVKARLAAIRAAL